MQMAEACALWELLLFIGKVTGDQQHRSHILSSSTLYEHLPPRFAARRSMNQSDRT